MRRWLSQENSSTDTLRILLKQESCDIISDISSITTFFQP